MLLLKPFRRHQGSADDAPPARDGSHPITFITHPGLPPKYSHSCWTPWSVFQDGSFKAISSASSNRLLDPTSGPCGRSLRCSLHPWGPVSDRVYDGRIPQSGLPFLPGSIKGRPQGPTPSSPNLSPEAQTDADSQPTECTQAGLAPSLR